MARILVVDDIRAVRRMLRMILERAGHEVEEAEDGFQAVKAAQWPPADLVLCDLFMPEKEGLQTIRELRNLYPGVRIIAMSGGSPSTSMDFLPLARHLGAARTLGKPFTEQEVLEVVAAVLDASPNGQDGP